MFDLQQVLEELPLAITITDLEGTIVYMNAASAQVNARGGGKALVGKQVRDCHNERSKAIIERLFQGETNVYTISKQGQRKLIYQCPWRVNGEVRGLVELSAVIPEDMPHYVRG